MKTITVVQDGNCDEAMYVDGTLVSEGHTIYACEIEFASEGNPFILIFEHCKTVDIWPKSLSDLTIEE